MAQIMRPYITSMKGVCAGYEHIRIVGVVNKNFCCQGNPKV